MLLTAVDIFQTGSKKIEVISQTSTNITKMAWEERSKGPNGKMEGSCSSSDGIAFSADFCAFLFR